MVKPVPIRRKNLKNPADYLQQYLKRKQSNPIAKSLSNKINQSKVVPSGKVYNRNSKTQEKNYESENL